MFGGKKILQEKVTKLEEDIKDLEASHEKSDNERNLHVHELQVTVSSILKENADLESEKAELEDEITSVKQAYNDRLSQQQEVNTSLQTQVEEALGENMKLQGKLDDVTDRYKEAERERAKERTSAIDLQSQLTERLEDVQKDLKLSLERNERLSAQIKKINEDSQARETKLNAIVLTGKNEIQTRNNEINQLKEQVQVAMQISAEEKQASEDSINELDEKLDAANTMLQQRQDEITKLENAEKKYKKDLAVLADTIEIGRKKMVELKNSSDDKMRSMINDYENEKDVAAKKFQENMSNILNEMKMTKEKLNEEKKVLSDELTETKGKLENLTLQANELKTSLSVAVEEKTQATELMQSVLDSKTSEASEQLKTLEEKLNLKIEENSEIQLKLDNITITCESIKEEKDKLEKGNAVLSKELIELKATCTDLNGANTVLQEKLEEGTKNMKEMEENISNLSEKLVIQQQQEQEQQQEQKKKNDERANNNDDNDNEEIIERKNLENEKLKITIETLNKEIANLLKQTSFSNNSTSEITPAAVEQVNLIDNNNNNEVMKQMENEHKEKLEAISLKMHQNASNFSLEKESFLERIKTEVLNNEKLQTELNYTNEKMKKLEVDMEKLAELSRRKEEEMKASNKMIVTLNDELSSATKQLQEMANSNNNNNNSNNNNNNNNNNNEKSAFAYRIKDLQVIPVTFPAGPMGLGLSPLTPGSTITIIRNLTPGQNNNPSGVERYNTDQRNVNKQIIPGMVLKMVNDKSVIGMPYKRVIDMLMKTKRPIQLVFVSVTFDDGTRRTESIDEENPFL